jgi:hypothetical protein
MGYPPVTSTMSNAVGLVAGNVTSTWGYRRELRGQWDRLVWQVPASVTGAILGAWLLLHLSPKVFIKVVPVLLIIALILVVLGPRIQAWARDRAEKEGRSTDDVSPGRMAALVASTFVVGRLWRLFHCGARHSAGRCHGRAAARIGAADERGEEFDDAAGECRCGAGLNVGGVRPDKLAGCRPHRRWLADRRVVGRTLRPSPLAKCAARRDCGGRPHRGLPAVERVAAQPFWTTFPSPDFSMVGDPLW